jgi:hypothetical protein
MSGGILPDVAPRLELVDEDFVPSPPPGSSLYDQPTPIPIAEYWHGVFQRNDPEEHARIAAAYDEVMARYASPVAVPTPEATPTPSAPETESTAAPTASAPPPDDDGGGTAA